MAPYDGFEPSAELQGLVNSDLQCLADYGSAHPDDYGGHWIEERHAYGVSFTKSVEAHEATLAALLSLPDRLRVTRCSYSYTHLRNMQEAIWASEVSTNPDRTVQSDGVVGIGVDVKNNVLRVRILPGHPEVEERLTSRFGPMISVEIGERAKAF